MTSAWMGRIRTGGTVSAPASAQQTSSSALVPLTPQFTGQPRPRDPNVPDNRFELNAECIYERRLPSGGYITAHVQRLQSGFYDSPVIHEDLIGNCRYIAINFVFHPARNENRFQSADIIIGLHDATDPGFRLSHQSIQKQSTTAKPRFLRHAPHLLYGAISPETLNWNFNLAGSLGVSQTPVTASLAPSGGVKGSYKLYDMMKIQGSVRTLRHWSNDMYNVEDGELLWTLEENSLQKSGIPRQFTFVMLVTKGDAKEVTFDVRIEPRIASWFGHYPMWWNNLPQYQPLHKDEMDLDKQVGQKFEPTIAAPGGFNFANLMSTFDDFVTMPGTTYSTSDPFRGDPASTGAAQQPGAKSGQPQQQQAPQSGQKALPGIADTLNVHVYLEGHRGTPSHSPAPSAMPNASRRTASSPNQRATNSPTPRTISSPVNSTIYSSIQHRFSPPVQRSKLSTQQRAQSLRRSRSRSGLKQFGELQDNSLHEIPETPVANNRSRNRNSYPAASYYPSNTV